MKKMTILVLTLTLILTLGMAAVNAEEAPEAQEIPYDLVEVESVGTMDMEEGVDKLIYCIDGRLGRIDYSEGEAERVYLGFAEEDFVRMIIADDAQIFVPTDMMDPVENQPLESPEAFCDWVDALAEEFRYMLHFRFELNENDEAIKLEYNYEP